MQPSVSALSGGGRVGQRQHSGWLRGYLALVALINLVEGTILFLAPETARQADSWAWPIASEIGAQLLGAIFLTIGLAVTFLFFRQDPATTAMLMVALAIYTVLALVVAGLHVDLMAYDKPFAWLWTGLYVAVPILSTLFYWVELRPQLRAARGAA